MCNDNGIPIPGCNPAEQAGAVAGCEVFFSGSENIRSRIKREQFGRELREHVIRHDKHRLRRQPKPLQLNCSCDHRVGLARADDVRKQGVIALNDSPDGILLMRVQRDLLAARRQREMTAVENTQTHRIEFVIVFAA